MDFTLTFLDVFFVIVRLAAPLLGFLLVVIIICGQFAGRKEGWSPMNTLYWTLITATTVGYGDMRPTQRRAKILSLAIAIVGLMLTGILVAISLNSANFAFEKHVGETTLRQEIEEHVD